LYRTKTNILQCPSAMKRRPDGAEWGSTYNTYWMPTGGNDTGGMGGEEPSYGGSNWIYNPNRGVTSIQSRPADWNWRSKDVAGSNEIPIFGDAMWRGGGPCYRLNETGAFNPSFTRIRPAQFDGQWLGYDYEMMHFAINRHDIGTNMLFMDFTVRKVGLKELWKLRWHRKYPINGPLTRAGGVQPSDWPEWMRSFKDY